MEDSLGTIVLGKKMTGEELFAELVSNGMGIFQEIIKTTQEKVFWRQDTIPPRNIKFVRGEVSFFVFLIDPVTSVSITLKIEPEVIHGYPNHPDHRYDMLNFYFYCNEFNGDHGNHWEKISEAKFKSYPAAVEKLSIVKRNLTFRRS
jgi:hypothetical protein